MTTLLHDSPKTVLTKETAIALQKIYKSYRLHHSHAARLKQIFKNRKSTETNEFYALSDISFEIPKGSTVGILGQNGSGKSTLLQLITGVLHPTQGAITVSGKVAALLELGAGFNPMLTGRENVIMNGLIMGSSKSQMLEKMEEIQAFADIGTFFDQPMRCYSSGMFMRVAFAAAIHVDPDILIIDEALSVGDAKFQEKCFRRFRNFQDAGKTILLVTHDRSAVPRLCNLGILLHQGKLITIDTPKRVVDLYSNILATGEVHERGVKTILKDIQEGPLTSDKTLGDESFRENTPGETLERFLNDKDNQDRCHERGGYNKNEYRYGNGQASIIDYLICTEEACNTSTLMCDKTLEIYIKVHAREAIHPLIGLSIRDPQGILLCGLNSGWLKQSKLPPLSPQQIQIYKFSVRMNLRPGPWFIELAIASSQSELCDIRNNLIQMDVIAGENSFDGLVFLENDLEILL